MLANRSRLPQLGDPDPKGPSRDDMFWLRCVAVALFEKVYEGKVKGVWLTRPSADPRDVDTAGNRVRVDWTSTGCVWVEETRNGYTRTHSIPVGIIRNRDYDALVDVFNEPDLGVILRDTPLTRGLIH